MQYISTRGNDGPLGFEDALLSGLARDGGLYLPTAWPRFSIDEIRAMQGLSYVELAGRIMAPFCEGEIDQAELTDMARDAYSGFDDPSIAPLVKLNDDIHVLELFHGPTIAFKDYAMQFLARAFDRALQAHGRQAVILGATSGDTGSAALEAFQGRDAVDVFILFPEGRVSPVQQRQMTSVDAPGVHAVAVPSDFDACQDIVKTLFNEHDFRDAVNLSAVNSINWARLMPQIVYYFSSALALGAPDRKVAFSVPTGNFGNVFAGYVAAQMGLPIERLIVASNQNDILTRFFESGTMQREAVAPSHSPSMDIQVSSNFERLLFELLGRDGTAVNTAMATFAKTGRFDVAASVLEKAHNMFAGYRLDDAATLAEIRQSATNDHMVLDPHSAVGVGAARMALADGTIPAGVPIISLACAHPAKFQDAVASATGEIPALPAHLSDLMSRSEKQLFANATPDAVKALVLQEKRSI
ncbi:threonine synthase [Candidatus Puniceispirillum sp.]|uniref:threonine synthase n=1 Tax=Candidatus Puniceispirillum sp. TaxID=2026719 RepID=UPI001ECB5BA7|nr:threonine synthase [Candidatus Puniceispirillum sp.]